jgi:hypothetical protein
MAHFAGKGTASGEQTKGTVSERVPSNGSRATEALREYRSVVGRTWRSSAAVVQMRDQLDPVDISAAPPPENRRESTLRKEVSLLKRLLAEKTLEVDFLWREAIYDEIQEVMPLQGSLSIERMCASRSVSPAFFIRGKHGLDFGLKVVAIADRRNTPFVCHLSL